MATRRYWITLDDQKRPKRIYKEDGGVLYASNPDTTSVPGFHTVPDDAVEINEAQFTDLEEHIGRLCWNGTKLVGYRPGDEGQLYQEAIGDFLQTYAWIESLTFTLLQYYSGVSNEIARALFSGTRVKGALEFMNRIAEFTNAPETTQNELKLLTDQLGIITSTRDLLVHYGSQHTGQHFLTTNKRVFVERPPTERILSRDILRDIRSDLEKIAMHIGVLMDRPNDDALRPGTPIGSILHAPWRYKPAQPESRKQTPPDQPPKRPPQPKSSPASRRKAAMDRKK